MEQVEQLDQMEQSGGSKPLAFPAVGYQYVKTFVAVLLLVAAGLKAQQLATEPTAESGLLSNRWFLMIGVEFEIFLGLWLLTGLWKRRSWMLALGCFCLFSAITLYKAVSGQSSCGCFGRVAVNPWITLVLDVAVVTLLAIFRPGNAVAAVRHAWARLAVATVLALGAGIPAWALIASYQPAALSADGRIIGDERFVVLTPEQWVGKTFPLFDYIDIPDDLRKGKWMVALYHHDCHSCRQELPGLIENAKRRAPDRRARQLAIVEMPPYGDSSFLPRAGQGIYTIGKLKDVREWFVTTPAMIELDEGTVVRAKEGDGPAQEPKTAQTPEPSSDSPRRSLQ